MTSITLAARLDAKAERSSNYCPPSWLRDLLAERKLTGGYDTRRANQCPSCYQQRSANGACACSD